MHETALVRDVVQRMIALAAENKARRVTRAKLWLGAFSHLTADHFREHFVIEARNTVAAAAALDFEVSSDPHDPDAQQVRLESVEFEE